MPAPDKHIVIIAGEASGDMHAALLVKELQALDPSLTFSGLGGEGLKALGVELYADLTRLAVVGFLEVLKHYREIKKIFDLTLEKIQARRPAAVILVDYPGFNLRLARELKKRNIKVIYYISPQVWAWKEKRVETIRKFTDKLLVLFAFEKDFYARHGIAVDFVGHPLIDTVLAAVPQREALTALGLDPQHLTVGLLPGSRQREIETLLPVMLRAAQRLQRRFPQIQFLLLKAPTVGQTTLEHFLRRAPLSLNVKIVEQKIYDGINACDLCMVTSGTATLETAILGKPMVVVYKTSLITWVLAKFLVKIPYIGLVNVVAGERVVPECIQFEATPKNIAAALIKMQDDPRYLESIKAKLNRIRDSLGAPGASRRAAREILKTL